MLWPVTTGIALVLTAAVAAAQQTGLVDQYRAADRYAKVRIISESVSGKRLRSDAAMADWQIAKLLSHKE